MKPFVKYRVIQCHSGQYPVSVMCQFFGVSRSGYYDFLKRKDHPDKDAPIAEMIAEQQEKCFHTYGYRRMWKVLKKKDMIRNPKTILRIMKKYDLLSEIRRRRKWVTDISYIHTKQGILYLSVIRNLYDRSIVAYKTGTKQTVNLVLDTIRLAVRKEKLRKKKVTEELRLHSDQGFQYTSHGYFKLTQFYGITPSMSRRGNCYDNALAENFFGILKTECIYRHKPETFKEANEMIDRYIHFYNHERIQLKTGVVPLTLHHSA